jgi:hypothetical protein
MVKELKTPVLQLLAGFPLHSNKRQIPMKHRSSNCDFNIAKPFWHGMWVTFPP